MSRDRVRASSFSLIILIGLLAGTTAARGQQTDSSSNVLLEGSALPWVDAGDGIKRAQLYGNAQEPGQPFAFRLMVPDGFEMGPHTHPIAEHMTVISGKFFVGIGRTLDRHAAKEFGPGSYVVIGADVPAYMWAVGETVVQIHGIGPLQTIWIQDE